MPYPNVHWKGRPHRHLPRIRVASFPSAVTPNCYYSNTAAQNVAQNPLGTALEIARQQERIKARARRGANRRSSADNVVRRRVTQKAKRSPLYSSRSLSSRVASSSTNSAKIYLGSALSMTTLTMSQSSDRTVRSMVPNAAPKNSNGREEGNLQVNAVEGRSRRVTYEPPPRRRTTYDPRLPVKKASRRTRSTSSRHVPSVRARRASTSSKRSAKNTKVYYGRASNKKGTSGSISNGTTTSSVSASSNPMSELPSRSPRQIKALRHFTRELERHLVAQQAIRGASLASSATSISGLSTHTIKELMPYMADFQAAGLAVTSSQQRYPSALRPKNPQHIATVTSTRGISSRRGEKSYTEETATVATLDSQDPIQANDGAYSVITSDVTSSDTTIIDFTSVSDAPIPLPLTTGPVHRKSTKKTLPWLRKDETMPDSTYRVPTGDIRGNEGESVVSYCSSVTSDAPTTVIDFSPQPPISRPPPPLHSADKQKSSGNQSSSKATLSLC